MENNNECLGIAYVWRERHHYWVEYHYDKENVKPKRENIGQKKINKLVCRLNLKNWKVFIKMPDKKGFKGV